MSGIVDISSVGAGSGLGSGSAASGSGSTKTEFPPTEEQQRAIDIALSGDNLAITAYAATGKTFTLVKCVEGLVAQGKSVSVIAFNKKIADELALRMPREARVSTSHSLAYRATSQTFLDKLNRPRVPDWDVAKLLKVYGKAHFGDVTLSAAALVQVARGAVRNFRNSADMEVESHHVPRVKGAEEYREGMVKRVLPIARAIWADIADPNGVLPAQHDDYLTLWAMKAPQLGASVLAIDEGQDVNPRLESVLNCQKGTQLILCGDKNQTMFRFRGTVDAMSRMQNAKHTKLTQSFRFSPVIAEKANILLRALGESEPLLGWEGVESRIGVVPIPDAVLCRTNAGAIDEVINLQAQGVAVAFCGGTADIERFAKAAKNLQQGRTTLHSDLSAFDSWDDVVEYSRTKDGQDMRAIVSLVDRHGPDGLLRVARDTVSEQEARTVVATVHKVKGLQYPSVRIANDFRVPTEETPLSEEELMVAYVAITRAQNVLDLGGLSFIDDLEWGDVA